MKKAEVLIVGQGIAGSLLAMECLNSGISVEVIDNNPEINASKVAAGLYNPITGRKMVKTWLADEIFGELPAYYDSLQKQLNAEFHHPANIYRPFGDVEEQNDWAAKSTSDEYRTYVERIFLESAQISNVLDPYGGVLLKQSGTVALPAMLSAIRTLLSDKGIYHQELFDFDRMEIKSGRVEYKDVQADRVIFCEGAAVRNNPFWRSLRLNLVKGEVMDVKCDLDTNYILNKGVFMVRKEGFVRVGSTYERGDLTNNPSEKGKNQIFERLEKYYTGSIEIVAHRAGVRPASYDRRPFVGFHPEKSNVGIFNGFGTKGVSLVPYFAKRMVNHILKGEALMKEVDPMRG